ncbi:MAG: hypothetical protein ACXWRE_16495 [Pseudobdellovibrionaceae bacterium]
MKFAKFILAAALILPFFVNAQESMPVDPSAPPAAPSLDEPPLTDGAPAQPSAPASELGETKKPSKKKAKKKAKKANSKKGKKNSKKSKKGKKKKHHPAY